MEPERHALVRLILAIMRNFRSDADPAQQHLLGLSIDDIVRQDHRVRRFAALLGRLDYTALRLCYSGRGKPAYPPEAMFGLLVWTLERFGPVSLRKMEEFAATDMTCRLAAGGFVPDHVTISDFLARCGEQFAALHAALLKVLFDEGLLTGRTLVVDGSKIPSARCGRASVLRPGAIFDRMELLAKQLRELYGRLVAECATGETLSPLPDDEQSVERLAAKVTAALRDLERLRAAGAPACSEETPVDGASGAGSGDESQPAAKTTSTSPIATQALALVDEIDRARDALAKDFRRLPRQLHPGDPSMHYVKTATEGIRAGANLQVLSTEDGFIQAITVIADPTDVTAMGAVLDAAAVQRPAVLGEIAEIVTDGGYATIHNADACAKAGVILCTPAPAPLPAPTSPSVNPPRTRPKDLEQAVVQAINEFGPSTRSKLRELLSVRTAIIGRVVKAMQAKGIIVREAGKWCLAIPDGSTSATKPPTENSSESVHDVAAPTMQQSASQRAHDDREKPTPPIPHRIPVGRGGHRQISPGTLTERIIAALQRGPLSGPVLRKTVGGETAAYCAKIRELKQQGVIRTSRREWMLAGPSEQTSSPESLSTTPSPASQARPSGDDLYFDWDSALGTFLCPIGRPMSPREPDTKQRPGADPIPGIYVAANCSICPLAAKCLSQSDFRTGRSKQLTVGGAAQKERALGHAVGHANWRESSKAQRLLRSQHAEGRFLSLKHLRHMNELPYKGTARNGLFAILNGVSYNTRRAIDLTKRKETATAGAA